jgi:rRNA small subunit pseudouridine methyltransferase Nep1
MAKFLTILLAESSLEIFPEELLKTVEVRQYLSKLKKTPQEVILDASYHSNFMKDLQNAQKRGRPDIVHFTLLSCCGSIMAREQRLRVIIHTNQNKVIELNPEIRLPKNIDRFKGLILQLFKEKSIPPESDAPLMSLRELSLSDLINELRNNHDLILEFSVKGEQLSSTKYSKQIYNATNPLLIFGAYPHGEIENIPNELVDKKIAIYQEGLDLFAVISQILAVQHMIDEEVLLEKSEGEQDDLAWE